MHNPFRETASLLVAAGYSAIPIVPGTKRPALTGWQRLCAAPLSPDEIERFSLSPVSYGVGVALGFNGLIAIDIDTDDAEVMAAIRGVQPTKAVAKHGRRGVTLFGREPSGSIRTRHFAGIADILGAGAQTVLPPTQHPAGVVYSWTSAETLLDTPIGNLPVIAPDIADQIADVLSPWMTKAPRPAPAHPPMRPRELLKHDREQQRRYAEVVLSKELRLLAAMGSNSGRNQSAFRLVCRVGRWVHHGIVPCDRLTADVIAACEVNGLVRDDGRRAVLATIESALAKSSGDALPDLGARHG